LRNEEEYSGYIPPSLEGFRIRIFKMQCHVWFPENFSVGKISPTTFSKWGKI